MFKRHNEHLWTQPNLHHVEERRSEIELLMPNGSEIIGLFGRDYFCLMSTSMNGSFRFGFIFVGRREKDQYSN